MKNRYFLPGSLMPPPGVDLRLDSMIVFLHHLEFKNSGSIGHCQYDLSIV
jgi:hypothetical protein